MFGALVDGPALPHKGVPVMTHITSGTVFIWIAQWEYQCCGTPITSGDVVDLTVCETDWAEPWQTAVGGPIPLAAEHHVPPEGSHHLKVRVERLMEARAHRIQDPDDEGWYLVPGSGEVCDVATMKVWNEEWQPARVGGEPEGWILEATVLAELPPQRNNIPYGIDLTPRLIRSEERDLPRLDDVVLSLPRDGKGLPLLAAWQPAHDGERDGFVDGHPCIATSITGDLCTCLYIARGGLLATGQQDPLRDMVVLEPGQFLRRALNLMDSNWAGFDTSPDAGALPDYADLFLCQLPPHPELM